MSPPDDASLDALLQAAFLLGVQSTLRAMDGPRWTEQEAGASWPWLSDPPKKPGDPRRGLMKTSHLFPKRR